MTLNPPQYRKRESRITWRKTYINNPQGGESPLNTRQNLILCFARSCQKTNPTLPVHHKIFMHLFFVVFCMNVIQQKKNQLNRSLFLSRQRKFIIFVWRHGGYVAVWNEETAAALVEKTLTEELNTVQFNSFFFLLFTKTRWPLISRLKIMHAPWVTPSLPLNSDTRPSNGNEHINGLVLKHISTFARLMHRLVDMQPSCVDD